MAAKEKKVFKTYSGYEPYAFFSYAHLDDERVLPVVEALDRDMYRLWYDAGIEAGTNWVENVASHLLYSDTVLIFMSRNYLNSHNCIREVNYAVSERKKMICIWLDDSDLSKDMAMQLSAAKHIKAQNTGGEELAKQLEKELGEAYIGDGVTGYEKIEQTKAGTNRWRIVSIVFALLLAALAVFMIGYFNNWWGTGMKSSSVTDDGSGDTIEITKFKDPASRLLVLKAFKGPSVYCCGDYRAGKWYVGDDEAEEGSFDNRSIITENENIEYLALVNMGMKDCSDLAVMEQLTYLDISGNPVNDIGFLKDLENIQVLKIIDIDAEDLSVLADMPKLKYLYIDKDRYDEVADVIDSGTVDIVVKK